MSDEGRPNHPDLDTLASYAAGEPVDEATPRHVKNCAVCRMEVRRLDRFERLQGDEVLLQEADWPAAQPRLERAFRQKVLPEVFGARATRPRESTPLWTRWQIRWLVPAAAAAAVLLVVFQSDWLRQPVTPSEGLGPVRGTPVDTPDIILEKPVGNIAAPPEVFEWKPKTKEDFYTIEIFTSGLEKIFEVSRIPKARWAATDSLKGLFESDTLYLWSVTGHKGVEPVTVSPNAWFKITDERP